jgi:hypothetical protein
MSLKTAYVFFIFINLCGAPELSGKLIISNTAMVLDTIEFERKNAFLCDVALSFCYKAAFIGICRTA